jgi:hypothetical protein
LTKESGRKEHVVGRRFVPKGSLAGQWNLIIKACADCNLAKSNLEDDISAITLTRRAWFQSQAYDEPVLLETQRKAENSISRKTRKPVKNSEEQLNLEIPFGSGGMFKFGLISPPQIESTRVYELAEAQLVAFFYCLTFNEETQKGGWWPGGFYPVTESHCRDWGNSIQRSFMHAVASWEPICIGNTANDFFKVIIRKHPQDACYSWALEWNNSHRVVGFFGDRESVQAIVNTFTPLKKSVMTSGDGSSLLFREEIELAGDDDLLFAWDK